MAIGRKLTRLDNYGATTHSQIPTMSLARRLWKLSRIGLCSLALLLPAGGVAATDTNSPSAEIVTASAEPSSSNETLRAYLQLQEQIHEAQLDIERNRLLI